MTPGGLEPPTDRTGICYSIQLNYGAISLLQRYGFLFSWNNMMKRLRVSVKTSTKRINGHPIWINVCTGGDNDLYPRSVQVGPFYGS